MKKQIINKRRYNLVLPAVLYNEIEQLATDDGVSVLELMRKFISVGLLASKVSRAPGAALIIRDAEGAEREIIFV